MVKCVSYEEVKDEMIQMMRRKMLIPVIGSGFTQGCLARTGKVPSGNDYYQYMINQLVIQNPDEMSREELER